jgi:hypothetical protein
MQYIIEALKWLSGKKSAIIGILALIITYFLTEGVITDNLAYLLNGILIIIGGGASYATKQLVYGKK